MKRNSTLAKSITIRLMLALLYCAFFIPSGPVKADEADETGHPLEWEPPPSGRMESQEGVEGGQQLVDWEPMPPGLVGPAGEGLDDDTPGDGTFNP